MLLDNKESALCFFHKSHAIICTKVRLCNIFEMLFALDVVSWSCKLNGAGDHVMSRKGLVQQVVEGVASIDVGPRSSDGWKRAKLQGTWYCAKHVYLLVDSVFHPEKNHRFETMNLFKSWVAHAEWLLFAKHPGSDISTKLGRNQVDTCLRNLWIKPNLGPQSPNIHSILSLEPSYFAGNLLVLTHTAHTQPSWRRNPQAVYRGFFSMRLIAPVRGIFGKTWSLDPWQTISNWTELKKIAHTTAKSKDTSLLAMCHGHRSGYLTSHFLALKRVAGGTLAGTLREISVKSSAPGNLSTKRSGNGEQYFKLTSNWWKSASFSAR